MHAAFIDTATPAGADVRRFGAATALVTPSIPVIALNRVMGIGVERPLSPALLGEIRDFYRMAGCPRWFVEWSTVARTENGADLLAEHGGQRGGGAVKLAGEVSGMTVSAPASTLTVVEIGTESAGVFAAIVGPGLSVPAAGVPGILAPIGHEGWHYYLALDGERPIAGAALFHSGAAAWLGLCATVPEARGRGAQTALLARRIDDARRAGCDVITAETHPETEARGNPSLRNMRRAGFTVEYLRPWYRFESGAAVGSP